jgi:succinyl-CoA synthetase beta subunit
MAEYGINVPPGIAVRSLAEVGPAAAKMADAAGEVVVKSQVLAGGRGLGRFTNGLQGGVHICSAAEAPALAARMLGGTLVTKQTGAKGKPVDVLYVAHKMKFEREMYLAILLDRASAGPVVIACGEGGTSIEDLAERFPDRVAKVPIDPAAGMTAAQVSKIVDALGVTTDKAAAGEQVKALYRLFCERDCTMVEVNPLAETATQLVAADAKLGFDDNAAFRQKDLFALRDASQEDAREVEAAKWDLNYIGLDGSIGCMVNGAGLAMATMDICAQHGGAPANFLDVGGAASEAQVAAAFRLLTADPQVKAILVNIFGGIMRCDVMAAGIVGAAKEVGLRVPLVVRLEGTNVERGRQILAESDVAVISADDLDDAAQKAVAAIA